MCMVSPELLGRVRYIFLKTCSTRVIHTERLDQGQIGFDSFGQEASSWVLMEGKVVPFQEPHIHILLDKASPTHVKPGGPETGGLAPDPIEKHAAWVYTGPIPHLCPTIDCDES